MSFIPVEEASKVLGLKESSSLYTSPRYKRFVINAKKGSKGGASGALFDLGGYRKYYGNVNVLIERTKLFTEYLRHECNMKYDEIGAISKTNPSIISGLHFGQSVAMRIVSSFRDTRPELIAAFDEYYDW